jgi:hypothetical protein
MKGQRLTNRQPPRCQVQKAPDAVAAVLKDHSLQGPDKQAERQQRVRQIILDTFD